MMNSITVSNYRSFKNSTTVELRPITILLGRNSSGKSSLTRLIPLLRQSIERPSSTPVLWTSETVDLGNINDVINHSAKRSDFVEIGFNLNNTDLLSYLNSQRIHYHQSTPRPKTNITYNIRLSAEEGRTAFRSFVVKINEQSVSMIWDANGRVNQIYSNGILQEIDLDIFQIYLDQTSIFPTITRRISEKEALKSRFGSGLYSVGQQLVSNFMHHKTSAEKKNFFSSMFSFVPKEMIRENILELPNIVKKKTNDKMALEELSNALFIDDLGGVIRYIRSELEPSLLESSYVAPVRASGNRFDRIQELSVDRIDSTGTNVAIYIFS